MTHLKGGSFIETETYTPKQIYDRIFKRIFSLSDTAIINLINGLFFRNFPLGSKISYLIKEFIKLNLESRFADMFITISDTYTFHLEAQITYDNIIVLRVFEYSFYYAMSVQKNPNFLHFPEPVIIYLNHQKNIPEESILHISFGSQGSFDYHVKNFVYPKHSIEELNKRKMAILIPFQILRLRSLIETQYPGNTASRTNFNPEKFSQLQDSIRHDIMNSIHTNLSLGNITSDDASQLLELTNLLYEHIADLKKKTKGAVVEMKPLLPGAIELPNDKYRFRIDELEKENTRYADEISRYVDEISALKKRIRELEANSSL